MLQKIKDNLLLILVFIAIVWLSLTMKSCNQSKIGLNEKHDTTIVHHRDTIWAKDTLFSFKNIKIPVAYPVKGDTIYKPIYIDTNKFKIVQVYQDSLIDSNITLYYKDYVQGALRGEKMS